MQLGYGLVLGISMQLGYGLAQTLGIACAPRTLRPKVLFVWCVPSIQINVPAIYPNALSHTDTCLQTVGGGMVTLGT